jgi:DNA-damage-inducible protein D
MQQQLSLFDSPTTTKPAPRPKQAVTKPGGPMPVQGVEVSGTTSPFDRIRRGEPGSYFWSARDLMQALGYKEWRNFRRAVEDGAKACESKGGDASEHFVEITVPSPGGNGAMMPTEDYRLSRLGCYLAAMSCRSKNKPEVAAAKVYFAEQTRRQELNGKAPEWVEARETGKVHRKGFTAVLQSHGAEGRGYADCTDTMYQTIHGAPAAVLKRHRGLPKSAPLRDSFTADELASTMFAEVVAARNIVRHGRRGNEQLVDESYRAASVVAAALDGRLRQIGGVA